MNKKGFTLIEGLMVIAIIGVLLLTLIPSVIIIINKNKQKNFEHTRDSIIEAAKMYVAENKYNLNFNCSGNPTDDRVVVEDNKDNIVGYGNLSKWPDDNEYKYPAIIIIYDCNNKSFEYKYIKAGESIPTTDYSSLTYNEVKENASSGGGSTEPSTYNIIIKYVDGESVEHLVSNVEVNRGANYTSPTFEANQFDTYNSISCVPNSNNVNVTTNYNTGYVTINNVTTDMDCTVRFVENWG